MRPHILKPAARSLFAAMAFALCAGALTGCHSAFIQATVVNQTGRPLSLFEVDYPSASFGSGELAGGAQFHYRFKVLGSGPVKIIWTDATAHEFQAKGPDLREGLEGTLTVLIGSNGHVAWEPQLHSTAP